jgi:hypothetical protein
MTGKIHGKGQRKKHIGAARVAGAATKCFGCRLELQLGNQLQQAKKVLAIGGRNGAADLFVGSNALLNQAIVIPISFRGEPQLDGAS